MLLALLLPQSTFVSGTRNIANLTAQLKELTSAATITYSGTSLSVTVNSCASQLGAVNQWCAGGANGTTGKAINWSQALPTLSVEMPNKGLTVSLIDGTTQSNNSTVPTGPVSNGAGSNVNNATPSKTALYVELGVGGGLFLLFVIILIWVFHRH